MLIFMENLYFYTFSITNNFCSRYNLNQCCTTLQRFPPSEILLKNPHNYESYLFLYLNFPAIRVSRCIYLLRIASYIHPYIRNSRHASMYISHPRSGPSEATDYRRYGGSSSRYTSGIPAQQPADEALRPVSRKSCCSRS